MRGAAIILEQARAKQFLTYPELWAGVRSRVGFEIGDPWRQVPILLEYISDSTYEAIGLFVTALVVDGTPTNRPSEGFFRLAAQRGALPEADAPPTGVPWTGMTARQSSLLGGPDIENLRQERSDVGHHGTCCQVEILQALSTGLCPVWPPGPAARIHPEG